MMYIVISLLLFLLVVEEVLHRLNRGSPILDIDMAGDSVKQTEVSGNVKLNSLLFWLRILQLVMFGFLVAVIASSTGVRLMSTPRGKLSGLLLLLQVSRILNRKIINQWAVLGAGVLLQAFLLILLLLLPGITETVSFAFPAVHGGWIMSLLSFSVLFALTVTIPFTSTFFLRMFSREGSGFYSFLPTLAYSEYWIRRLSGLTVNLSVITLLMLSYLIFSVQYPAGESIMHITVILLVTACVTLMKNQGKLYHPLAVFLVTAAWLIRIAWLILDLSAVSSGWFA